MRRWVFLLVPFLELANFGPLVAAPPEPVTFEKLLADPAKYEGKSVVVSATVSGAVVEGPKWLRLSVNGRSAELGVNKGRPGSVNFVVPKGKKDVLLKGWKEGATHTAELTLTPQLGQRGRQWFAVVSGIVLKVKAEVRDVSKFPDEYVGKTLQMVVWVDPDAMSKSKEADGQYHVALMGSSERLVQYPSYGSPRWFVRDEVNFLIPAGMAKSFWKDIKPGNAGRYTVTLTLKKEKTQGGECYVGRITKAE